MIEFVVWEDNSPYGAPGDEVRLFLDEAGYRDARAKEKRRKIKIKRYAHIIEGHILIPKKKHRRKD